ncbi:MAG: sigma-70 family RNA polymerase sigma factor, partial [Anaerolineae bacterium]|nr:sigma-70 family RNA polymerase sigma factor [Anaerolineae bacterium]
MKPSRNRTSPSTVDSTVRKQADEKRRLNQAQRGDADAFAALYRENVQAVFRYIVHRVNDHRLAEDLTADVFTRALEGLSGYRDQGKPFIAWLYRIAHDRVIDHYRRVGRRRAESDIDDEPLAVETDMDAGMLRRQAAQALRRAIAELTDEQQQVIILRFIEGYRIETVAEIMGKQPNAIKALQFRALRSLAGRLERSGFNLD